ncbi:hypothetical protein BQ8482_320011 [Mesorhizobium delmotii]|uniref:Uncharacterized protein n=1 Tax=Mesorhizobium delmotii TaxID=1631247 RepID=A0A2P9ANZ0_9HYPH|nr:hypothetical protein BQ8482_320011 [Mesorhizobium delmotii]
MGDLASEDALVHGNVSGLQTDGKQLGLRTTVDHLLEGRSYPTHSYGEGHSSRRSRTTWPGPTR